MKKIPRSIAFCLFWLMWSCLLSSSFAKQVFVYDEYQYLMNNINAVPQAQLFNFINQNISSPLGINVRNQWLRWLAKQGKWQEFISYYTPDNGVDLDCDYLTALYSTGKQQEALAKVKPLWLVSYSQPDACKNIFSIWKASNQFLPDYVWQRIELALIDDNLGLVRHLMQLLPNQQHSLIDRWIMFYAQPQLLTRGRLATDPISKRIVLSSLKKWVEQNPTQALNYWHRYAGYYHFSHAEQQEFIQRLSLYLALSNDPSTEYWFKQLDASSLDGQLRSWRIRHALLNGNWQLVKTLIESQPEKNKQNFIWQYWYARSLGALNYQTQAYRIYKQLCKQRNYYGFLACYRLKTNPHFAISGFRDTGVSLAAYNTEIRYIKSYLDHQKYSDAILLTRHLLSKLTPAQGYALAKVFASWQWYIKSLAIANDPAYQNDLNLRFPMPYANLILNFATNYQVSPAFIYAIMRQESAFQANVKSTVGAVGLMQLTIPTAKDLSKKMKIPLRRQTDLLTPKTNIRFGTAYLNNLSKHFNQHPILMAAAYNAGPHKVLYWLQHQPTQEADIWIETLPFHETRVYLKHILAFETIYRKRLNLPLSIEKFMHEIKLL